MGIDTLAEDDKDFVAAWNEMESQGYIYSDGNIEKVHLGWEMAKRHQMKSLLRTMFEGWCLLDVEQQTGAQLILSPEECMANVCNGDHLKGELLTVFGHWSNDIVRLAAHYGIGLARMQPDKTLLYEDGTVDTLLKGGKLTITEIPQAPSPEHYWHCGQWNAPEEEFDQSKEA